MTYDHTPAGREAKAAERKRWKQTDAGRAAKARERQARKARIAADPAFVQIQIRLPVALHRKLRRRAFADARTLAGTVRALIETGLRKPKTTEPAP